MPRCHSMVPQCCPGCTDAAPGCPEVTQGAQMLPQDNQRLLQRCPDVALDLQTSPQRAQRSSIVPRCHPRVPRCHLRVPPSPTCGHGHPLPDQGCPPARCGSHFLALCCGSQSPRPSLGQPLVPRCWQFRQEVLPARWRQPLSPAQGLKSTPGPVEGTGTGSLGWGRALSLRAHLSVCPLRPDLSKERARHSRGRGGNGYKWSELG